MPTKLHMETYIKEKIGFLPDKQVSFLEQKNLSYLVKKLKLK